MKAPAHCTIRLCNLQGRTRCKRIYIPFDKHSKRRRSGAPTSSGHTRRNSVSACTTPTRPRNLWTLSRLPPLLPKPSRKQRTIADAKARAKAEHDRIAAIGAERLRRIMPDNVQGVIVAELNETEYTDPSYECRETRSVRTVILGFSTTSRNGFGELRKAARNLPETAYLAEYNKDYELRYPGFTLGKSPSYGWSIHKMTHYTREGFIDALAYIAGDENNIRLSSPKPERTPEQEQGQTSVQGDFILVNYSEKAIALFGDTKPIKDALSDLGGRFNGRLTYRGEKCAGWIFPKAKEMQVRELIGMAE